MDILLQLLYIISPDMNLHVRHCYKQFAFFRFQLVNQGNMLTAKCWKDSPLFCTKSLTPCRSTSSPLSGDSLDPTAQPSCWPESSTQQRSVPLLTECLPELPSLELYGPLSGSTTWTRDCSSGWLLPSTLQGKHKFIRLPFAHLLLWLAWTSLSPPSRCMHGSCAIDTRN